MNIDLNQSTVKLEQRKTIRLNDAIGSTIVVLWGAVWITQSGDAQDYVLGPGESFAISARGITLATALQEAAITILQSPVGAAELRNEGAKA